MKNKLNKIFANVEQVIITLLKEGRYSHQLLRSIEILSVEIYIPSIQLDCSITSLRIIDNYLNQINDKTSIDLETYLAITIYFSQVLILSCNGIWSIMASILSSPEEMLWIYFLRITIYNTNYIISSPYIAMTNILGKTSKLNEEAVKLVAVFNRQKSKIKEVDLSEQYNLTALDNLIAEGKNFNLEISLLISNISNYFNIPKQKLNKSVSSLKLIDESIRTNGRNILYDTVDSFNKSAFLSLIVYVGEVLIKAIGGKWKVNPEKIITTNYGSQYHWNLRILNSEDRVLRDFIDNICDHLFLRNHTNCCIEKLVKYYIIANKRRDEHVWYNLQPLHKNRIWKMELTNSFVIGLNDEIGTLSDLIIPIPGF